MITLVTSKKDVAGMNIAKHCEQLGLEVTYIEEEQIFAKNLDERFPSSELFIILSKHASASGKPCLTAHHPGNFSEDNSHGGNPKELAVSHPSYHKEFLKQLWRFKDELPEFQIVTEPTHHGPTENKTPVLFVEIGATEKEWSNEKAGEIIAKAVKETIEKSPKYEKIAIAFGGPHYSEKFTKVIIEDEYAIGHICPKYAIKKLDKKMVKQMIEKSVEKPEFAIIDKKGVKQKSKIISICKDLNLEVIQI